MKCHNYHVLNSIYETMEEQLSSMSEIIDKLNLNEKMEQVDVDLNEIKTELSNMTEQIGELDISLKIDKIDLNLGNIEGQLSNISNVTNSNLDDIEDKLADIAEKIEANHINTELNDIVASLNNIFQKISVVGEQLDYITIELHDMQPLITQNTEQLKIANQIALLEHSSGILTDEQITGAYRFLINKVIDEDVLLAYRDGQPGAHGNE